MAMDISRVRRIDEGALKTPALKPEPSDSKGLSFKDTLAGFETIGKAPSSGAGLNGDSGLKFSNHAVERMRSRGVNFNAEQIKKLEGAVKKASEKGSRDSLVLMNDTALIVSVKNRTVVTVVDKASLKDNVFTNIDSTIVV